MGIRQDLTGQRFGLLLVTGYGETRRTRSGQWKAGWSVVCDCGNHKVVDAQNLKGGRTSSCGCQERGIGRSSRYKGKPSWLSKIWKEYESGARKRQIPFNLTIEQVAVLVKQDCCYCGEPPAERRQNTVARPVGGGFVVNGIDRKDPAKGYNVWNVVPCCTTCNRMKMALGYDQFVAQVLKVASHVK